MTQAAEKIESIETENQMPPLDIVHAINLVQAAFAKHGIAKTEKNKQQGYMFRSIDAMYSVLNSALRSVGMAIVPRVTERHYSTFQTKNGGTMHHVCLKVEYKLCLCSLRTKVESGRYLLAATYGEAMDAGDKATPKAMTAAFKSMLVEVFSIPYAGEPDADSDSPEEQEVQLISKEQAADLRSLLEETGSDVGKFLKWAKVSEIEEIPAKSFDTIVAMVRKKR